MSTTRRSDDGTEVPWREANAAWAVAARPVLERAAEQYNAFLTYQQLAEAVQEDTGIVTGVPFRHWIGGVLGAVAAAERPDEPILTALVVRADGSVGDGYAIPVTERDGRVPDDLDAHAAAERLACYRHFGADLPSDGGSPKLTPAVAQRRANRARRKERPREVCPTCRLTLPLTGECDFCGPPA